MSADRHPAEVRLDCVALVAAHPECFRGALIPAAAELAAFVLDGTVPGESKPEDAPKMANGFLNGCSAAQQAAQDLATAMAERPTPVYVTTRVRFTQQEAQLIRDSGGSLLQAARVRAQAEDALLSKCREPG